MAEHTPTPWRVGSLAPQGIGVWARQGPINVQPAIAAGLDDAAFIVRAVNAHDALVEALADLRTRFRAALIQIGSDAEFADIAVEKADAALRLARGE